MTPTNLLKAMVKAEEFIQRANRVRKVVEADPGTGKLQGCKDTAACRRSSMELTNALVEVRRG